MAFWKDFQKGFDWGYDTAGKYLSKQELADLDEERLTATSEVTATNNTQDMNDNAALGRKSTGGSNKMGGPWDAPDGTAPVEGLQTGDTYKYLGQTFDNEPNQFDKEYAYQQRVADIYSKYGQADRAESARRMAIGLQGKSVDYGMQQERLGMERDRFGLEKGRFELAQVQDERAAAKHEADIKTTGLQQKSAQLAYDVALETRGKDVKWNEFLNANPNATPEQIQAAAGSIYGPIKAQEMFNGYTSATIQETANRAKSILASFDASLAEGGVDAALKLYDDINDGFTLTVNRKPDGSMVVTQNSDAGSRVLFEAEDDVDAAQQLRSRMDYATAVDMAKMETERVKAQTAAAKQGVGREDIERIKAITPLINSLNSRISDLDTAIESSTGADRTAYVKQRNTAERQLSILHDEQQGLIRATSKLPGPKAFTPPKDIVGEDESTPETTAPDYRQTVTPEANSTPQPETSKPTPHVPTPETLNGPAQPNIDKLDSAISSVQDNIRRLVGQGLTRDPNVNDAVKRMSQQLIELQTQRKAYTKAFGL